MKQRLEESFAFFHLRYLILKKRFYHPRVKKSKTNTKPKYIFKRRPINIRKFKNLAFKVKNRLEDANADDPLTFGTLMR